MCSTVFFLHSTVYSVSSFFFFLHRRLISPLLKGKTTSCEFCFPCWQIWETESQYTYKSLQITIATKCLLCCFCFSAESGATASSGDLGKANKKIKDLEHKLTDREHKVMEITTELMDSVKKNRDVSTSVTLVVGECSVCVCVCVCVCVTNLCKHHIWVYTHVRAGSVVVYR